ncbi:MAG: 30S ribosomal protein S1 [Clostridia bacterium]|nr:30S ribosomal protein S1 [Clostridia bacterium]
MSKESQDFAELYENSLKKLEEGTVVEGTIVDIIGEDIFVDLGYKADGVIPRDEFSYSDEKPADKYKVGDTISAYILRMNNGQGNILLSTKRLQVKQLREEFENNVKEDKPVQAKVTDVVNGGVIAESGNIKIFVPQTQLAKKVTDLVEYRGKCVALKIIEYNPEKRKIVGSERKLANEEKQKQVEKTWSEISEGKVVKGTVKQLTDYGAFVDIGGVDGLLHISEISWKQIKHPSEVLRVGQEIEVSILKADTETKKISLGYRKAEDNPWANVKYQVGDIVDGTVVSMKPFGAFVELPDGLEGLVHISNITMRRIAKPQDALEMGQEVTAKVVEVDLDKKRIELSIRELEGAAVEGEAAAEAELQGEQITLDSAMTETAE